MPSLIREVGQFTLNNTIGNQTVTLSQFGGQTPKAIIFFSADGTADGFASDARIGTGIGVSSVSRAAICGASNDAVTTTVCRTRQSNIKTGEVSTGVGSAVQYSYDIVSLAADQFTINITTAKTVTIHYIALGGSDLLVNLVEFAYPGSGTTQSVPHGLGVVPSALFVIGGAATTVTNHSSNRIRYGMWTSGVQHTMSANSNTNITTSQANRFSEAKFLRVGTSGTTLLDASITSVDATNVNLTYTIAAAYLNWMLCIGGVPAKLLTLDSPTAGGLPVDQSITGAGFTPSLAMFFSYMGVAAAGSQSDLRMMVGASDGTRNKSVGMVDKNGVTTSEADRFQYASQAISIANHTPALIAAATVQEWGNDGMTVRWSQIDGAVSHRVLGLLLGGRVSVTPSVLTIPAVVRVPASSKTFSVGVLTLTVSTQAATLRKNVNVDVLTISAAVQQPSSFVKTTTLDVLTSAISIPDPVATKQVHLDLLEVSLAVFDPLIESHQRPDVLTLTLSPLAPSFTKSFAVDMQELALVLIDDVTIQEKTLIDTQLLRLRITNPTVGLGLYSVSVVVLPTYRTTNKQRDVVDEQSGHQLRFQLVDAAGIPVDADLVSGIELTLFDRETEQIINGQEGTSVLDVNGGVYLRTLMITDVSQTNPAIITTSSAHRLRTGDRVKVFGIEGPSELNNRTFIVENYGDNQLRLMGVSTKKLDEYVSGGTLQVAIFTQQLAALDNVIVDGSREYDDLERHVAMFDIEAGNVQVKKEIEFDVRQLEKVTSTTTTSPP